MGALWTLFAAALDNRMQAVECERGLVSYRALTRSDRYLHGANVFVRDALLHFDLGDVAAMVAGRELTIRQPVDARMQPVSRAEAESAYAAAVRAFDQAGGPARFRLAV
jgi:hypothetical protein